MTTTYTFKYCWVNSSPGYTETVFHDGTRVVAMPEASPAYGANAAKLGYGEDIAALSREHEILHTFLAEKLRDGASPTLWAVAHGQQGNVAPVWEQEIEEAMVLAFQAHLNGAAPDESLTGAVAAAGLSLDGLRAEARELLRPLPAPPRAHRDQ